MLWMFTCISTMNASVPGNIQQYVTVSRIAGSTSISMTFSKQDTWTIYQGTSPGTIDKKTLVACTKQSEIRISNLDAATRYYFLVVNSAGEEAIVSETGLAISGQPNFRDLGGIVTTDGHHIKWGVLFRSGALNALTNADKDYMKSVGIKRDIDFRNYEEKKTAVDNIPFGVDTLGIPILTTIPSDADVKAWLVQQNKSALDTMFYPLYRLYVTDFQYQFKYFCRQLETEKGTVYHCSGGKDRTGFATMILLSALGVDIKTIMDNYLATNAYIEPAVKKEIAYLNLHNINGELLRPSLTVNNAFLQTSLDMIDRQYGGMDKYITMLGINIDKLKKLYLEK